MQDSRALIDSILSQTDIVTVISSYIKVEQKGRNYVSVCPFHDDHHPSMSISKEKQIFKCFSCGASGNAISFVEKYEHIPFFEALRKVAEIMGIDDARLKSDAYAPKIDPQTAALYSCINDLARFYEYALTTKEGETAREYLIKRGITQEDVAKYSIGYSPRDGQKTIEYLRKKGHSVKMIEDIGISVAKAEGMSDTNAGRLMFSIKDPRGQIVGYSARRLADDGSPKYINSPETPIFKKRNVLYNYHNIRQVAHHEGYVYLLEGFMDVIALGHANIPSAVALMGTSLTADQIALLRHLNAEVRLSLDGDAPGQEGMMKIIAQLNKAGLSFRLVNNPGDTRDPDDIYSEEGPEKLRQAMNNLVDPFTFQVNYYSSIRHLETPEERLKVMHYFIPQLRNLPAGLERENTIVKLSKATGYEVEAIRAEINKAPPGEKTEEEVDYVEEIELNNLYPKERFRKRLFKAERETLYYMLSHTEAVRFFMDNIDNFYTPSYNEIANYIVDYVKERGGDISLPLLVSDIESDLEEEEKDSLVATISDVSSDNYHPEFSLEQLRSCAAAIGEEKEKMSDEAALRKSLSDDLASQTEALAEYAKRHKERLRQKKKTIK